MAHMNTNKNGVFQVLKEFLIPEKWQAALILVYTAVGLMILEYYANTEFFNRQFPALAQEHFGLYSQLWWAFWTIVIYVPIPMLIIYFVFREKPKDYGFFFRVKGKHLALYIGMYLVVLPFVIYASTRTDFQSVYPFYRGAYQASMAEFLTWEISYLLQFVALEFFFRGFLVIGLERYFGRLSVWVAVIPYGMIHFHKPVLEAAGAIIAGLVLGEVSRRTRSILGGVIAHGGVALTMDLLALNR